MNTTAPSNICVSALTRRAVAGVAVAVLASASPGTSFGQQSPGYARDHLPLGYSRDGYPLSTGQILSVVTEGERVIIRLTENSDRTENSGQAWRMEYEPASEDFVEKVRALKGQSVVFLVFQSADKVCVPECRGWIYNFKSGQRPNRTSLWPHRAD
jgi:hypothetical protein